MKALALAVGLTVVAACGSGAKSATTTASSTTSTSEATTAPSTTSTTTAVNTTAANSSTTAATGDQADITKAVMLFFDGSNPNVDAKVAVLENGEKYRSMLVDAAKDPTAQTLSTKVKSVEVLDAAGCQAAGVAAPCAKVVHDLFAGDFPAFSGQVSYAVNVGGKWMVAAKSWCAIVALGGASCPA